MESDQSRWCQAATAYRYFSAHPEMMGTKVVTIVNSVEIKAYEKFYLSMWAPFFLAVSNAPFIKERIFSLSQSEGERNDYLFIIIIVVVVVIAIVVAIVVTFEDKCNSVTNNRMSIGFD